MLEGFVRTIQFAKQTLVVRTYFLVTTVYFQQKIILKKIRRKFREDYVHKLALNDPVKYTLTYRDITPSSYQSPFCPRLYVSLLEISQNITEKHKEQQFFNLNNFRSTLSDLRNISSKTSFKVLFRIRGHLRSNLEVRKFRI